MELSFQKNCTWIEHNLTFLLLKKGIIYLIEKCDAVKASVTACTAFFIYNKFYLPGMYGLLYHLKITAKSAATLPQLCLKSTKRFFIKGVLSSKLVLCFTLLVPVYQHKLLPFSLKLFTSDWNALRAAWLWKVTSAQLVFAVVCTYQWGRSPEWSLSPAVTQRAA